MYRSHNNTSAATQTIWKTLQFIAIGLVLFLGGILVIINIADKLILTSSTIERQVLAQAVEDVYPRQSTDLTARVIEWNDILAHNQYWTTRLFTSWFLNSGWLNLKPIPMPEEEESK